MIGKKISLCALVAALSSSGCAANLSNNSSEKNIKHLINDPTGKTNDKGFDSIINLVDKSKNDSLADATYLIVSESQYVNPAGETETFHSFGSSFLLSDVGERTILGTADHVVDNKDEIFDFWGGKYEKKSERFYLLEDHQVHVFQEALKVLSKDNEKDSLYFINKNNQRQKLEGVVKTSEAIKFILSFIKPKEVRVDASNEVKDAAIISVKGLKHVPITYKIGDPSRLKRLDAVVDVGYPLVLFKTLSMGKISSVNDSYMMNNPKSRFVFTAPISPGSSGGPIFVSEKGRYELIGFNDAMYLGGNSLFVGVKIDVISDVLRGNTITCSDGWECNKNLPYQAILDND